LTWEDLLAANGVALGALASAIMEGPKNLEFIVWNVAALILAGPVLMIQDKASARSRRR
jgi:hypothetical protein